MAGLGISCLYLGDSGILRLHQRSFSNSDKDSWLQPSSCPGNPLPLVLCKGASTIIAALSLTVLHYPHKNEMVWIHDANVSLAKYIPLALVALLFLLFLFLPYTLLLLLGQWLQTKSHLHLLSWVKSPNLKAILDAYHAPYKPKHRFWTGLLLFIRCALFLVFAFNISGNDSVNLLVISSTNSGIFI